MEPVSATVLSIALGAAAIAGKEIMSGAVRDAYSALKGLILQRYPKASVAAVEQAPASKARQAVLAEDLAGAGAAQDPDLAAAARAVIAAVEQHAPAAAAAIGVELKDVAAANLRLADIVATGTGVRVERGTFTGDIDIRGVRAGTAPPKPPS
jgi:hypothetical protein